MILNNLLKADYAALKARAEGERMDLARLEEEQLGITHAAVGLMLAKKWAFPRRLCEAVQFHHSPVVGDEIKRIAAMVYCADAIERESETPLGTEALVATLEPRVSAEFRIDADFIADALRKAQVEFEEAKKMFNIRNPGQEPGGA